jgi:hypothetical protein
MTPLGITDHILSFTPNQLDSFLQFTPHRVDLGLEMLIYIEMVHHPADIGSPIDIMVLTMDKPIWIQKKANYP